ncbi:MAG: PDZ domain-containing protein, partial [Planctomycetota bacterium]
DALDKQFYGPGAPAQPTPTQPGPALSDEQKRKLEALRQEMYAEIEKELDATRARLRKLVDETIARMAASATPEDPAPTTPPATGSVPFLGIVLRELDDDFRAFTGIPAGQGMGVDSFDDGSPAPAAGVQKMDVLMKADGQPIGSQATLDKLVAAKKPGDVIVLELIRDGRVTIRVTLAGKAGRVEDGRPAWAYTPAHVAGESFAGIGRGATEADAARSASENLIAAASVVARQAARRYMLTTLHAQQQKVSESYLGEIMYSSIPPLHDKVRILRKEAAAGYQWAQASLPFQALVESLANGLRATYRRIDGPNVDEQKLRLLVREEHDKLIAAGGSAMTDTTPTPTPTPTPGERLPALGNGVLGLRVAGTDDGVEVRDVTPGSPADTAGIRAGDVIVTIDGQAVTTNNALRDVLEKRFVGDTLKLTVQRAGRTLNLNLTIGKRD